MDLQTYSDELVGFIENPASQGTFTIAQIEPFATELGIESSGTRANRINAIVTAYHAHTRANNEARFTHLSNQLVALQNAFNRRPRSMPEPKLTVPKLAAKSKRDLAEFLQFEFKLKSFGTQVGLKECWSGANLSSEVLVGGP